MRHRAEAEGPLCDVGSELHSENLSFGDLLCLRCLLLVLDLRFLVYGWDFKLCLMEESVLRYRSLSNIALTLKLKVSPSGTRGLLRLRTITIELFSPKLPEHVMRLSLCFHSIPFSSE